ncbi:hypothetical protein DAQ1742_02576 [Dickeya aquatica]|uniref:Uncharacterized protein n=1 Tax=Dickeya aquatica TaxID=1401087 RepID=A0A375ABG7_9GAMM|nr:hypothetical protein DAQ1742_02576 [Dickeya aquatica]
MVMPAQVTENQQKRPDTKIHRRPTSIRGFSYRRLSSDKTLFVYIPPCSWHKKPRRAAGKDGQRKSKNA